MKWWVLAAAIILWASTFLAVPAQAHDQYKDWKAWDGGSCCSERVEHPNGHVTGDCRPVRATQDMDGNWIAYERGKEYRIPPQAIRPIQSPDGRSHLCEMHGHIFCFVPGEVRS
jgi:hypothetical protein